MGRAAPNSQELSHGWIDEDEIRSCETSDEEAALELKEECKLTRPPSQPKETTAAGELEIAHTRLKYSDHFLPFSQKGAWR